MDYRKYLDSLIQKFKALPKISQVFMIALALFLVILGIYFINPSKKLRDMRNSQRRTDVSQILNVVYQYSIDNNGSLPFDLSSAPKKICRTKASSCEGMIDLAPIVAEKKYYFDKVPVDPKEKSPDFSGYEILKLANGRINVIAPNAEKATISLSK